MRHLRATVLAAALVAGLGTGAQARTLQTGPIKPLLWNDSAIYCAICNVGATPLAVKIEGVDGYGSGASGTLFTTLAPGQGKSHLVGSGVQLCRFAFEAPARNVRAAAILFDGTDFTLALPAR